MSKKVNWSAENDAYIAANWESQSDEELAAAVGHPLASTHARRVKLGFRRRESTRGPDWSETELNYLAEVWGEKTIPQIAKKLGRTINAVKIKSTRLGYRGQKWYGEMMSARKVAELLGVDDHTICDHWILKYGLKGGRKRLGEKGYATIIRFSDLLIWLEKNQDKWDSRKVELYGLGVEYGWLVEKRKADAKLPPKRAAKWTAAEDAQVIKLYKKGDLTYAEIAKELGRSRNAVANRIARLDVWGSGKYIRRCALDPV